MRFRLWFPFFVGAIVFLLYSCLNQSQKDERLARQACASCHLFPDPELLDKKAWADGVFPQMAFRMGMDYAPLSQLSEDDQNEVTKTLPPNPMVSKDEWEAIKRYYIDKAPDSLLAEVETISAQLTQFEPESRVFGEFPLLTFVKTDTIEHKIYVGSRLNKLYRLNDNLVPEDSFELSSPPSHIFFTKPDPVVSLMGIMDPNDQARGEISILHLNSKNGTRIIDSLKRPVHFELKDLNKDGLDDFVVCAFGNYSGALLAFKGIGNGKYERLFLQNLPGARRVIIRDFDGNGMDDILALMTQGDERIILLLNQGNFNFRISTLLRFPPVYGSSYFDVADFNNDGKFDILYTNGDNADYSMIRKPYHGVRVFFNSGSNDFKESWFYNMHGATQAAAQDFDGDGDLDIAAISFFPDFVKHPEQGFMYFENKDGKFTPQITNMASKGRWLTMEATDIDKDGDCDLILAALGFNDGVPAGLLDQWKKEKTSLLVLRNKHRP
ncbi:MAG TPA: VCBS repeat-containing protein [Chryseolinea sp.]|nr:VCBS repeat-containing protein [Chryseolinea sp.]